MYSIEWRQTEKKGREQVVFHRTVKAYFPNHDNMRKREREKIDRETERERDDERGRGKRNMDILKE